MYRGSAHSSLEAATGSTVSRETWDQLQEYQKLLARWTRSFNLISRGDAEKIFTRHVLECAQLYRFHQEKTLWLDLGSGAGFPAIVLAILGKSIVPRQQILVESNLKKASFLQNVVGTLGLRATVVAARAEHSSNSIGAVDVVTARAFSNVSDTLALATLYSKPGTIFLFQKGVSAEQELAEASGKWDFTAVKHPSLVGDGFIVEVHNAQSRRGLPL